MLKHLYIRNFALIKELDIDLHDGFSVITGETGAGKSILLGALNLLLGQRADSKSILAGEEKCVIEANFDIKDYNLQSVFDRNEIDYDAEECIIRRELNSSGKSRAFVNDTPASVAFLKELSYFLIDIHSQHQNLLLAKEDYQLSILDIIAQNKELLDNYQKAYSDYKEISKKLDEEKENLKKSKEEQDYLQFQLEQLEELNPQIGEDEKLKQELNELSHAEDIKASLYQADNIFSNDSECGGVLDQLRHILQTLNNITKLCPDINEYCERIEGTIIELKDISADIIEFADKIEYNPQRLAEVSERIDKLFSLERKHNIDSAEKLIEIKDNIQEKLEKIELGDERILQMGKALIEKRNKAQTLAIKLSKERQKASKEVKQFISQSLIQLGIPNNRFEIKVEETERLSNNGLNNVSFLFNANKNGELRQLSEVASGGEISRVMLALKMMTSKYTNLPTIIFDEIDTGVSGKVADSMAIIMNEMCNKRDHQVIAITHLPQIAASGATHYRVYKEDTSEQTFSHIIELNKEQRIKEIANMLSASKITDAAIENAKQLLKYE